MQRWVCTALALMLLGAPPTLAAPTDLPDHLPEIIVRWRPGTRPERADRVHKEVGAHRIRALPSIRAEVLSLSGVTVEEALARLRGNPDLLYAEPNYIVTAHVTPDDPLFPEQWGLENRGQTGGVPGADIHAPQAWEVFTGSPAVVVGIVDTGIDLLHPDVAPNLWVNPGEVPANGVDDDHNGYVDDVHGWDFVNDDNDPQDDNGHGTHVSGIAGGAGDNGQGISGVAWNVRLMALKFLDSGGRGSVAGAVGAIEYATAMGARLTNNSWGGSARSQALEEAIAAAGTAGRLLVCSSGNAGSDNDQFPVYPANYDLPNVISVAATDEQDHLAGFSNYGLTTVDLAAPGVRILSTLPGGRYARLSGTSMAAPHVTGALALLFGRSPQVGHLEARDLVLLYVDPLFDRPGTLATGGRLNAFLPIADPDSIPPGAVTDLRVVEAGSDWLRLEWTAVGDDGSVGRATRYDLRLSREPIHEGNFDQATRVAGLPRPAVAGTAESFRVPGLDFRTRYYAALRVLDEFTNPGPLGPTAEGMTLGPPVIAFTPEQLELAVTSGTRATTTFRIANAGEGTLDFTIPLPEVILSAPEARADPEILGFGGPDGAGYRWRDSREPGGPAFDWVDVGSSGSVLLAGGDDANAGPFPIGFPFTFYGVTYTEFRVCSNGWLSFLSAGTEPQGQALPATGAPPALVAPYWDDLVVDGGAVRARREPGRLVVAWEGVHRFGSEGTYTFELLLHEDGTLTFQYLALEAPRDQATVGIQDATGRIGLTVAHDIPFAMDSLAVRLQPLPQWITVSPTQGTLRAPESAELRVDVDATGLDARRHEAWIHVRSNDPLRRDAIVPLLLDVTGAPDLSVRPERIDFPDVYVGSRLDRALTVQNPGTDTLVVTASTDSPVFAVTNAPLHVPPRSARDLLVTFAPPSIASFTGALRLESNDPDQSILLVPLSGAGVEPPSLAALPESLAAALATGGTDTRALVLHNLGSTPLTYRLDVDQGTRPDPQPGATVEKGALDTRVGILGEGGPDGFGYRWEDSREPEGPAFTWIEARDLGHPVFPVQTDGASAGPFDLGFSFPYYGETFHSVRVAADGYVSLTSSAVDYTNDPLPSPDAPENLIAPFWDDLVIDPAQGSQVYIAEVNGRFVIQYENVKRFLEASRDGYTFQVQLRRDGSILFMYRTLGPVRNQATIGIQNGRGDDGLTVAFNQRFAEDGLAIRFTALRWLRAGPPTGVIPAGGTASLTARFDAAGLTAGDYRGAILVQAGDPPALFTVPAHLTVDGAPALAVVPAAVDFGTVFVGFPATRTLLLQNTGTDVLHVESVTLQGAGFAVLAEDPPLAIAPGGEAALQVSALAVAPGAANAVLRVVSDDPEAPEVTVPLAASVLVPPEASISPATLAARLRSGESTTATITVANHGASPYRFSLQARAAPAPGSVLHAAPRGVRLPKGSEDPTPGLLGNGGPDASGYTWTDSDDPEGPAYEWIDVSSIGRSLFGGSADDDNTGPLPLGFPFPFYDAVFESVRVCTNGWLSPTSASIEHNNTSLPNSMTSIPENLIAVFWDDLEIRPGGHVYAAALPGRFVVQFDRVHRFRQVSGDPCTFQAQLYPDGTIIYVYRELGPQTESATLGIQNAARDDGLTVAYDTPYVREGLAVRLSPRAAWLRATPESGEVAPGQELRVTATIDAAGLLTGSYTGSIRFLGNDPRRARLEVPVSLSVTGIPALALDPEEIDFGEAYLGYPETLEVAVHNPGTGTLEVSRVSSDRRAFRAEPASFTLPPMGTTFVSIIYRPGSRGDQDSDGSGHEDHGSDDSGDDHEGSGHAGLGSTAAVFEAPDAAAAAHRERESQATITFASNAPDAPHRLAVRGTGVPPPRIHLSARRLAIVLDPGESATRRVTVRNRGKGELRYTTEMQLSADSRVNYRSLGVELAKEAEDIRVGILARGGPDAFGYRFTDSEEPGGPSFDWVDITSTGTPLFPDSVDDRNAGPFPIGFRFPFYGNVFDSCRVCTNGFLSFTSLSHRFTNEPLPTDFNFAPENLIAVLWDDFRVIPREGGQIHVRSLPDRFVVQFTGLVRVNRGGGPYTFQVQLFPDGTILYLYQRLGFVTDSATIGIQNDTRDDGLSVAFNTPYVREGLAVRLRRPSPWMRVDPDAGTLRPGARARHTVTVDATDLVAGRYDGAIVFRSNDPKRPRVSVPVTLEVRGSAAVLAPAAETGAATPLVTALAAPAPNPFTDRAALAFDLAREGSVRLLVVDVSGRRVREVVNAMLPAGRHQASWEGHDDAGRPVASGLYFALLVTGDARRVQRMFLVR